MLFDERPGAVVDGRVAERVGEVQCGVLTSKVRRQRKFERAREERRVFEFGQCQQVAIVVGRRGGGAGGGKHLVE